MILERRKIHFYSAIALAIVLPIVFIWGIVARPFSDIPNQSLVPGLRSPITALAEIPNDSTTSKQVSAVINPADFPKVLDSEISLELSIVTLNNNNESVTLVVSPQSVLKFPDPLLYWQTSQETTTEIDDSMILLGALPGKASNIDQNPRYIFDLPPQALQQDGALVLYSQGYNAIAAVFPLCVQNSEQPFVCQEN
ncbi:hypothetical protein Xen7305DRAFT_00050400 [Xenococcus sp. PCC 7305]|uniref:hypothetical protein n=1 Tax=Xenococcus sp. PCC 7305 TaxID=102125 RepID=UPI0002AD02D3|nr:hypothetical protein [Xenococcus sp. PCC 7305]ELS05297.1 hypothetical protein Xen7305DRAFT_00050400 [Xenococcus sp. PCC 7305]